MTQAQYAAFLRVGLRTLVQAEQDAKDMAPWSGSAIGFALTHAEFKDMTDLQEQYRAFKAGE